MKLTPANQPVTQQAIIDKLERYRKDNGNVIGKGVNRDAAAGLDKKSGMKMP